ncbi:MAG: ComEA family DNA-binding protein [Anaerolineaceae bacterium]|nr:ComEA family DNA-binding protein [Anaerolineaceae bacterium]
MKPWQNLLFGILLGLLFSGLILLFILPQRGTPIPLVTVTPGSPGTNAATQANLIKVDLAGAVSKPGLLELPEGTHLADALPLAGGLAPQADQSKINMALILKDGQKIVIPAKNTEINSAAQGTQTLLDINSAGLEQLKSLPQIGELKAQAILTYRNEHGPFKKVEELMEVPGIGESIFELIKNAVTIAP